MLDYQVSHKNLIQMFDFQIAFVIKCLISYNHFTEEGNCNE